MKKYLLFGSAFIVAMSAYSQNAKLTKPSGIIQISPKKLDFKEGGSTNSTTFTGPVKKAKPSINSNLKTSAVAVNPFTGSMNVFGYLVSQSDPLQYNPGVNAVSFVARKSSTYTASSNSNSGTIVGLYSTNLGTTWDETCMWTNATNLARYPNGGIWNPLGNSNINNAYIVGSGPITAGAWDGNWYASKQLSVPGTNSPGVDQQSHMDATPTIKKHAMSRYTFATIDGGFARSMATIVNDINNTSSNLGYGLRGAAMVKGQFNAGAFVWSVDSFVPPVNNRTDGSKLIYGVPIQAWSENGNVGYVVILGSRAGTPPQMSGYQPIVYITTNSGASWSLLPAKDFTCEFRGLTDRLYPINSNSTIICPNFSGSEGFDATVDMNGQLHLASMVYGHTSTHVDTLNYRNVFGTEQYSYGNTGPFDYPIIYDFYTTLSGGWDYHMVDSMGTEGPSGTSGQPGYGSNPWSDGSGAKMDLDARIQISRSVDGSKIFYSWTESDSTVAGVKWNIYPDLMMKGYDVTSKMVTPRMNLTMGVANMNSDAYYQYMSNKAVNTTGCFEVPFTIARNSTLNGGIDVDTWYISGAQACPTSFSIAAMSPKQSCITALQDKESLNFEVLNFPNPANAATTIVVGLQNASNFEVVLYNSIGQMVDTYKVNGHVGSNEINIDLSSFNSGIYFYNVKVGNSVVTKKLVIQ
ncbi:MAG: T9SS type A sorting domain-containing protein [Bacteroidia bacterium]|nr:T9SS type A sorting domain-containing protein [Bacteroidia bacterium]